MTDIFAELEDDIRRDRLKQLWNKYGVWFVAFAVLCVAAAAGWTAWRAYDKRQADAQAEAYVAVGALINEGRIDEAVAAYATMAAEGRDGYRTLAAFRQAALTLQKGDVAGAVAIYDKIAGSDADPRLKAAAAIRAAYASADVDAPDALKARVAPYLGDAEPWRFLARDISAYADYRAGRGPEAQAAFAALAADEAAPDGLRERARRFAAFLAGGGVIPAPPRPAAAASPEPAAPAPPSEAAPDAPPAAPPTDR